MHLYFAPLRLIRNTLMMIRFAFLPLLLALNFSMCKKQQAVTDKSQPTGTAAPATAAPVVAATPKIKKPVVDQTAQVIIFCYHRLVDKIRYPGTEITPDRKSVV